MLHSKISIFYFLSFTVLFTGNFFSVHAQNNNVPSPAMPLLQVPTDAQSMGMGGTGIATRAGFNALHFNSSKLVFAEYSVGLGASYVPFMDILGEDRKYIFQTGVYKQFGRGQAIGISFRRVDLGDISSILSPSTSLEPKETELAASYNFKLSPNLAVGASLKYLNSRIFTSDSSTAVIDNKGVMAGVMAGDFSLTYQQPLQINNHDARFTAALALSNVGSKVSYIETYPSTYLPTNLGIGIGFEYELADDHRLDIAFDVNRFLIPRAYTVEEIDQGLSQETAWAGIRRSFSDAPEGFKGEMQENHYAIGAAYQYKFLVGRLGYNYAHPSQGNRNFVTTGLGLTFGGINVDVSYQWGLQDGLSHDNIPWRFSLVLLGERN